MVGTRVRLLTATALRVQYCRVDGYVAGGGLARLHAWLAGEEGRPLSGTSVASWDALGSARRRVDGVGYVTADVRVRVRWHTDGISSTLAVTLRSTPRPM
ncbi:uncharacterized protein MYCFIDRAFT_179449 [Pseudocercospora fijiensis CIRAD86]|uniref:Uncharacterized protein n=1 Tax=Pseudocercospora fijiensis (strain CIRAD86) TaxID=383855 RepID=M2YJR3_PSEFD|nr:uncharacterized protein MYCFIDRAFT_179449 [Pseudocercospora fijiensis CIRAD86]EME77995.1 hypothetical protein MYCFIDRAFT_179449 [Pseudocercospora fijiensis CIRAD86]